ncbi:MAG: O-antigen polysaccharide polymerase Wzy [Myxococcota bacterium]
MSAPATTSAERVWFPFTTVTTGFATLVLFVMVMIWPNNGGFWGPGTSAAMAWIFFVVHVVACRRQANSFDPIIWVPVLMLLFFMGLPIAIELLGARDTTYDNWNLGYVPPRLEQGFAVALLSIVAFIFGVHAAGIRNLSQRLVREPLADRGSVFGPAMALMLGGTAMVLFGIVLVGPGILFADYGTMKEFERFGRADFRFLGTGHLFAQAGVFGVLACHDTRRPLPTWTAVGTAAFLGFMLLMLGDRGGLSALLFGTGFVFSLCVRRVPWWIVITGFLIAFLAVPLIGEYRAVRGLSGEDTSPIALAARTLAEMGGTVLVFCYTLYYIPMVKGYDMGGSFLVQTLSNIPNFGLNPTGWLFAFDPVAHLPSAWLTSTVHPIKWSVGGGYGYAYPAELYFNFGFVGVFVGMVATGFVTSWVRNRAVTSAFWITFLGLYISMMALMVRNAVGYPIRTAAWPLIGLLILRFIWPRPRQAPVFLPQTPVRRTPGPPPR